jgi:DNA invertase Pin-like site-specific DNA recombinase
MATTPLAATYARVSRADQNSQMQTDETLALVERRGWTVFEQYVDDGVSGSHARRPSFQAMLKAARKKRFSVLVVWRCDRLFRSLRDLVLTIDELTSLGIGFVSVTEAIDTTTAQGRLLLHLVSAFAEFERAVLIERTKAGLEAARRRGARIGRPRVAVDLDKARRLRAQGLSFRDVARAMGLNVATLHRAWQLDKRAAN